MSAKEAREQITIRTIYDPVSLVNHQDATGNMPYRVTDKVDYMLQQVLQGEIWQPVERTLGIGQMYPMIELIFSEYPRHNWSSPLNVSINEFIHRNDKWRPL